jgi:hypothetical protein
MRAAASGIFQGFVEELHYAMKGPVLHGRLNA